MSKVSSNISSYRGKHISHLCPFSLGTNNGQNHCAHFVSHVMGYELPGPTCKNFTWVDKQKQEKGATIRVDDLFKNSREVGRLADKPASITECLVFVTLASNVTNLANRLVMGNHPRKHIGNLYQGNVWNYSNTGKAVVTDTLANFQNKFSAAYKTNGTTVEFYYGKFL